MTQSRSPLVPLDELKPEDGARTFEGLYFGVISNGRYGHEAAAIADRLYRRVLADTKLTQSLRIYSLYPLYLYRAKQEYLLKSGMPEWSEGVFNNGRILIYEHSRIVEVLAHEIAHLIFWEFFGQSRPDLLWLNEGLAMYEEFKEKRMLEQAVITSAREVMRQEFIDIKTLTQTRTALHHQTKEAQIFYIESWLLVQFLLERGGNVGFYEMLKALKANKNLEVALVTGFPAKWASLQELEYSFKNEYRIR